MADDSAAIKTQQRLAADAARAASSLNGLTKAMDGATSGAIDRLSDAMIKAARNSSLLSDSLKDSIKTAKGAAKAFEDIEDSTRKIKDLEKAFKAGTVTAKDTFKALKKAGMDLSDTGDKAKTLNNAFAKLNKESVQQQEAIKSYTAKLSSSSIQVEKSLLAMKSQVMSSVTGFFTLNKSVDLLRDGFTKLYQLTDKLANQGMIGAIGSVVANAHRFSMTTTEFAETLAKNRNVINSLGGGITGINRFVDAVVDGRKGLEKFGKDANNIYSGFLNVLTKTGAGYGNKKTQGDTVLFADKLKNQFLVLNGLYGDTAEEFTKYYEELLSAENIQSKLNTLGVEEQKILKQELISRTSNLRILGITSEQLSIMNRSLDQMYRPEKNQQAEAIKERYMGRLGIGQASAALRSTGDVEHAQIAARMDSFKDSGKYDEYMRADPSKRSSMQTDTAVLQFSKDLAKFGDIRSTVRGQRGGNESVFAYGANVGLEGGGSGLQSLMDLGKNLNSAGLNGRGFATNPVARDAALALAGVKATFGPEGVLHTESTELAKAFGRIKTTLQDIESILTNPAVVAIGGLLVSVGAGLLLFKSGILGTIAGLTTVSGAMAGIGTLFKGIWGLAKRFPLISAIIGGGMTAYDSVTGKVTDEDYATRFRTHTGEKGSFHNNVLKGAGLTSDFLANTAKTMSFGLLNPNEWFADKKNKSSTISSAPSTVQHNVASSIPSSSVSPLSDMIAKGESGAAGYNAYNRENSKTAGWRGADKSMDFENGSYTLGQVMAMQKLPSGHPDKLLAVGRYQITPPLMRETVNRLGLDLNTPFTKSLQEQLYNNIINNGNGAPIGAYISGKSNDIGAAHLAASNLWGAVNNPTTGVSSLAYGNKSSTTTAQVQSALIQQRAIIMGAPPGVSLAMPSTSSNTSSSDTLLSENQKHTVLLAQSLNALNIIAGASRSRNPAAQQMTPQQAAATHN